MEENSSMELFRKIYFEVQYIISGPYRLYANDFWGRTYLGLQRHKKFKLRGIRESRVVYVCPEPDEFEMAILRRVSWNVREAHLATREPSWFNEAYTNKYLNLESQCVWVNLEWLLETIQNIESKEINFEDFQVLPWYENQENVLQFKWEKSDGLQYKLSWGEVATSENNDRISVLWNRVWDEMGEFLEKSEPVNPVEEWNLDYFTPKYIKLNQD